MIKLNINLDYKRVFKDKDEEVKSLSNSELTSDYINFAAGSKYPKGLEGQKRRIFGRIQRKIDDAIDNEEDSVMLENAEVDFIKACMKDAEFPAAISKYVIVFEDEVDRMVKEYENDDTAHSAAKKDEKVDEEGK